MSIKVIKCQSCDLASTTATSKLSRPDVIFETASVRIFGVSRRCSRTHSKRTHFKGAAWSHSDFKRHPCYALYQESSFTNIFLGTLPPHSGLRVEPWSNTSQVSVTSSAGTPLCPYGIAYGRVLERESSLLTTHWSESALSSR